MSEVDDKANRDAHPANMLEVDFALVVARLIETAKKDPMQLRSSIYELARRKLLDQLTHEDGREQRQMINALETAIRGVEAFSQRQENLGVASLPAPGRGVPLSSQLTVGGETVERPDWREANEVNSPLKTVSTQATTRPPPPVVQVSVLPAKRTFLPVRALLIVGTLAVLLGGGIYLQRNSTPLQVSREMAWDWRLPGAGSASPTPASSVATSLASNSDVASLRAKQALLPKTFGIYAVSGDRLFELEPLPGKVPDQRVAISAAINSPSQTNLPDGKIRFIVYRRDLMNNAPERAEVRVIAKVASAMTFANAGKPTVTATADTWVIRNISIGYRVAPVQDNADMFEIRNESDAFALSPGRYGLVIKGSAYDFTVTGEITDPDHCLERIEAANGSFYSPCQKP